MEEIASVYARSLFEVAQDRPGQAARQPHPRPAGRVCHLQVRDVGDDAAAFLHGELGTARDGAVEPDHAPAARRQHRRGVTGRCGVLRHSPRAVPLTSDQ